MDHAIFAVTKKRGGVLPLAIDTHDGGFTAETAEVIATGGVGQVMLHRFKLQIVPVEPEFSQHGAHPADIPAIAAIAIAQGVQRAIRGVPVTPGIVPARG